MQDSEHIRQRHELLGKLLEELTKRLIVRIEEEWTNAFHKGAFEKATKFLEKRDPSSMRIRRKPSEFKHLTLAECLEQLESTVGGPHVDKLLKLSGGNEHPWLQLLRWISEGNELMIRRATAAESTLEVYILAASFVLRELGASGVSPEVLEWLQNLDNDQPEEQKEFDLADDSLKRVLDCTRKRVAIFLRKTHGETALRWASAQIGDQSSEKQTTWENWDLPAFNALLKATETEVAQSNVAVELNCNTHAGEVAWRTVLNARNKIAHRVTNPPLKGYYRFVIYASASFAEGVQHPDTSKTILSSANDLYGDSMSQKQLQFSLLNVILIGMLCAGIAFVLGQWSVDPVQTPVVQPTPSTIATPSPVVGSPLPSKPTFTPSSPVPAGYLDSIQDARLWTYSSGALRNGTELTLHWRDCKGVASMNSANKQTMNGSVAAMKELAGSIPLKACGYCYSIENPK